MAKTHLTQKDLHPRLTKEIERLQGLLNEIIPAPDDDLTHADGVGWHCGYCGLCADYGDLESFEHHEDCWLVRARAALVEDKDGPVSVGGLAFDLGVL